MGTAQLTTDIAILGGGISGLLLAEELARQNAIIVIDKAPRGTEVNKYWVTPSCVDAAAFADLVDRRFDTMDFISHCGDSRRVTGDYTLWDGDAIISRLRRRAEEHGCLFLYDHHFYSFRRKEGSIVVMCEEKEIVCSLVIDCMGVESPLTQALSVTRIRGYYAVVGAELSAKREIQPICLHNVAIRSNARYLEVFPRSNGRVFAALIAPIARLDKRADVHREFNFILSHTPYKNALCSSKRYRGLLGIVPVGPIRRRAVDNIYFFGEAGQIHPAATGACLTTMLKALRPTTIGLTHCVKEKSLSARSLAQIRGGMSSFNTKFQLALYDEVLSWSSVDFGKVVRKMETIDDQSINDLLFGCIDPKSKITSKSFAGILKTGNWSFVRSLIRAALQ